MRRHYEYPPYFLIWLQDAQIIVAAMQSVSSVFGHYYVQIAIPPGQHDGRAYNIIDSKGKKRAGNALIHSVHIKHGSKVLLFLVIMRAIAVYVVYKFVTILQHMVCVHLHAHFSLGECTHAHTLGIPQPHSILYTKSQLTMCLVKR